MIARILKVDLRSKAAGGTIEDSRVVLGGEGTQPTSRVQPRQFDAWHRMGVPRSARPRQWTSRAALGRLLVPTLVVVLGTTPYSDRLAGILVRSRGL